MSGGYIQGNDGGSGVGGGVNVGGSGVFTMTGGTIYGTGENALSNTASGGGAALYKEEGTTATNGGEAISTTNITIVGTSAP
jgi:hypothetical protein